MLYNNLSGYLKSKYGKKIGKICIDGGFSCPNRDGTCGVGGCIFCGERGAGEHIDPTASIGEQVRSGLARGRADGYIAYFQNFTNTYAPLEVLRERYEAALIDDRIEVLAIGTRPDCITEEIAELIASFHGRVDVWVELGLQSASDRTAEIINRGYKTEVFIKAAEILKRHSIPVVAHMIIGLPGEGASEVDKTVDLINSLAVFGVKIHSIYVMAGTRLETMYRENLYTPPTLEEYTELAARCIERLSPKIVIHRLTGDCPDRLLVAPEWNKDKNEVLELIRKRLSKHGTQQGSLFTE